MKRAQLFAVLFMALVGGGLAVWAYRGASDSSPLADAAPPGDSSTGGPPGPAPRATVVNGAEVNMGSVPWSDSLQHVFQIRNDGETPLEISLKETSCHCILADLDQAEILPGETTNVTLTWKAEGFERDVRQTATLTTNDPRQPTLLLSVVGQIIPPIRPHPDSLVLSQLSATESREATLRIFAYQDLDLSSASIRFLDPTTAQFFEASTAPLPLSELRDEPDAVSGLLVTVRIKPGLPLGPVRQKMLVEFTAPAEVPVLAVPIQANVIGEVSVLSGPLFDRDANMVRLGHVEQDEGKSTTLQLLVKGPRRDDIQLEVGDIEPADVLSAEIGEARRLNNGKVLMYPLTIEIPPGSRPVSHIRVDSCCGIPAPDEPGRIQIKLTNAEAPELNIFVAFLVEGG